MENIKNKLKELNEKLRVASATFTYDPDTISQIIEQIRLMENKMKENGKCCCGKCECEKAKAANVIITTEDVEDGENGVGE